MGSLNLLAKYIGEMGRKWLPFLCKEHLRQEELTPNPVSSAATNKDNLGCGSSWGPSVHL